MALGQTVAFFVKSEKRANGGGGGGADGSDEVASTAAAAAASAAAAAGEGTATVALLSLRMLNEMGAEEILVSPLWPMGPMGSREAWDVRHGT